MAEQQNTTTALAVDYIRQARHHVAANIDAPYLKVLEEEIELDQKLGLNKQLKMDMESVLKKDINELTQSNEYRQVTLDLVRKMFRIPQLNRKCLPYNIRELIVKTFGEFKIFLMNAAMCLGLGMLAVPSWRFTVSLQSSSNGFAWLGMVVVSLALSAGAISYLIFAFSNGFFNKIRNIEIVTDRNRTTTTSIRGIKIDLELLKVTLAIDKLEETDIKIPRIAKLKTLEAKETGIFEDFVIAHPQFGIEKKSLSMTRIVVQHRDFDPAILGVTKDKRFFLICWWDLKHDVDRIEKNIRLFKKFKVEVV